MSSALDELELRAHNEVSHGQSCHDSSVDLGVHLPLMQIGGERLSLQRLEATVDAARDLGFAAVSANDHFVFQTP